MNKLMYRFVATRKKKKRNRPVFRHGMPPQGIPRNKPSVICMPWKANSMHGFVMVFLHGGVEKEGRPERGFSFHPTPHRKILFIGYELVE